MKQQYIPTIEWADVEAAYVGVFDSIAARRQELQARLQDRNNAIISAQQDSHRQSLEIRMARIQEQADKPHLHERIRRMRLLQISNLQQSVRAKVEELESKRDATVGFSVVAGGLARFRSAP